MCTDQLTDDVYMYADNSLTDYQIHINPSSTEETMVHPLSQHRLLRQLSVDTPDTAMSMGHMSNGSSSEDDYETPPSPLSPLSMSSESGINSHRKLTRTIDSGQSSLSAKSSNSSCSSEDHTYLSEDHTHLPMRIHPKSKLFNGANLGLCDISETCPCEKPGSVPGVTLGRNIKDPLPATPTSPGLKSVIDRNELGHFARGGKTLMTVKARNDAVLKLSKLCQFIC